MHMKQSNLTLITVWLFLCNSQNEVFCQNLYRLVSIFMCIIMKKRASAESVHNTQNAVMIKQRYRPNVLKWF